MIAIYTNFRILLTSGGKEGKMESRTLKCLFL